MRVLFIGNRPARVTCGGDQVNLRNISLLEKTFGAENLDFFPLDSYSESPRGFQRVLRKVRTLTQSFRFYAGGLDPER